MGLPPFSRICPVCGKMRNVVNGVHSGVKLKDYRDGMTPDPKEEKPGLVVVGPLAARKGYYEEVRPAGTESAEGAKPAVMSTWPPAKEGDPPVLAWDPPVGEADMPEEKPEE